jgi:60 kDa SS-A/Ro ribonucleoprotein
MLKSTEHVSFNATAQPAPSVGAAQLANPAAWQLDDWTRLDRFLLLGSDTGTFYTGERELTVDHAAVVSRCLAADGLRTIGRIVAISDSGRAPRNDPAIFALATAAKLGDESTRRAAYAALPRVCRIGSHLMCFAEHAQVFGGWGRGMRKAVGAWFNGKSATDLAVQLAKYQSRDGWSSRDLLRLAHPRAASPSHDRLFAWAVRGALPEGGDRDPALELIVAIDELKATDDVAVAAQLIRDHRIPRESVPADWLDHAEIWDALRAVMPMTAMLRHLPQMARVGLLTTGSAAALQVAAQLRDPLRLLKARIHPIAVLAALVTYRSGRDGRGGGSWRPVGSIVDALDAAFYASFHAVEPSGMRTLLAIDVSSSMASGAVAGVPSLSPRIVTAAMALVTAATEQDAATMAFTGAADGSRGGRWGGTSSLTSLAVSPRQRLDEVVTRIAGLAAGGTDCALPMIWAKNHRVDVDTFCVYTDNETWAGDVHPAQALRDYRNARGIPAKLVVVGMTSTGFSVADPNDAGMIDVVGFDTSTPPVIADFVRA